MASEKELRDLIQTGLKSADKILREMSQEERDYMPCSEWDIAETEVLKALLAKAEAPVAHSKYGYDESHQRAYEQGIHDEFMAGQVAAAPASQRLSEPPKFHPSAVGYSSAAVGPATEASSERIWCMVCGKSVSTPVPKGTIMRAWVECPECIERKASEAAAPEPSLTLKEILQVLYHGRTMVNFNHVPSVTRAIDWLSEEFREAIAAKEQTK